MAKESQHSTGQNGVPRSLQVLLCLMALAWAAAADSIATRSAAGLVAGLAAHLNVAGVQGLLSAIMFLFLLLVGYRALDSLATRRRFVADILPLPGRASWAREWGVGAAVGWGVCLAAVLPILVTGHLHGRLAWPSGTAVAVLLSLGTLLVLTLAEEVVFRGYAFRRLSDALGESWAAVLLSLCFAGVLLAAKPPAHLPVAFVDAALLGLLLSMAWLRTHALWAGWGLHFAYRAVMAVVLGLPIAGRDALASPALLTAHGPHLLTGGGYGPDAALGTAVVMLLGLSVLYRATRDFAWNYTYTPIVAGGYEVVVAPPAAHLAMERAAPPPTPLVQILPSTPRSVSALDLPEGSLPRR